MRYGDRTAEVAVEKSPSSRPVTQLHDVDASAWWHRGTPADRQPVRDLLDGFVEIADGPIPTRRRSISRLDALP